MKRDAVKLDEFLLQLRDSGISLSLEGEALRIQAPRGAVTPEIRDSLGAHKQALLAWLRESAGDDGAPLPQCEPDAQNIFEPFPLSDLQLGFYMADDPYMEFHVRPHYYIEKNRDALDVARYEAAWNKALSRHAREIVVVDKDGQLQVERDPAPLRIQLEDLRAQTPEAAQASMLATRSRMMRSELPLDVWPWVELRVSLWHDDSGEHARIHYNHNNFFSDGYGTTRLLQEVEAYYADPALSLPPLNLSFRDAALALDRLAESEAGQQARRYWEDRLPTLPAPPALPLRAGMETRCRSKLNRREGFVSASIWQAFKKQAQQVGLTPTNAVFACYLEVMACWSNSQHFVVSNMMTRRLNIHPEIRAIIGNFASLYPLEVDLRERQSFAESAVRIQEQVIRDARYLQWGGMRVMQALNRLKGSFGRAPVPYVVGSGLFMDGFERADFSCLETSQVLLDHQFWEMSDGSLYFVWDLLEEFFEQGAIDAMWSAYASLLETLAREPEAWQRKQFDLLSASQLAARRVLNGLSDLQHGAAHDSAEFGLPDLRLGELLPAAIREHSQQFAVLRGEHSYRYDWLQRQASTLADALRAAGLQQGERVAVIAERGAHMLAAVHGILQAGGAYVPVDPSLPQDRRDYIIGDAGARFVIGESECLSAGLPAGIVCIDAATPSTGALAANGAATRPPADGLAYIIYTSGSTGRPKGVMIDHRGALNTVLDINARYGVSAQDKLFGISSFGFDLSVYDIFGAAAAGATVVYPEPALALDSAHWLDQLRQHNVSIWNSAPPLALLMVEAAELSRSTLPALRLVLLSGDWIPVDLPDRLRRVAPNAQVVSLGGATEASIWSIYYEVDKVDPAWRSIPYGYPLKNQSWHILDAALQPVPQWVPGELYIGGIGLAMGYWNDEQKTSAAFITHPKTGERLYRTGDLGRYLADGAIEFLGRRDLQVKIQGHRIELGEIESVLCAQAGVSAAAVVAQRPANGGSAVLLAHVLPVAGCQPDIDALRDALARKLPDYMVPQRFNLVAAMPLSRNGKLDRSALPQLDLSVAPTRSTSRRPPSTASEEQLLALWQRVLKREDIGVDDSFFDLGGQSFEAVRLIGLIRESLGIRLSLGDVWQYPSIAEQAQRLAAVKADWTPLITLSNEGTQTPLFLVHPAGGHVVCYRHLAKLLQRPVHAFEARGVDGESMPHDSVENMARAYCEALQQHSPQGPLVLGGWSSGGPVAFEMASQLRAAGREIEGLVIFDSPPPSLHDEVSDETLLRWFVEDLDLKGASPALIAALHTVATTNEAMQMEQIAQALSAQGIALPAEPSQLAAIFRVFKAIVRSNRAYHAGHIDIDVLVLRAAEGCVSEFSRHPHASEPDWGWPALSSGRIASGFIPATHYTLLNEPAVTQCAAQLEDWLARRACDAKLGALA